MDTKNDSQVHSTLSHDSKPQNIAGESHSEPKPKDKKQILVFIPTGLPGMGKSTNFRKLTQILEEKGAQVTVISSDKVRKELMDKAREDNPSLSHQDAFNLSSKGANPKFFEYVRNAVQRTKEITQDLHVIILDKNHPPNIIQQTINTFKDPKYTKDYAIKVAMIKPVCAEDFSTKEATYPFSLTFFLKCVQRALGRGEHETLTGDDTKVASVLCGFFNFHKSFNASNSGYLGMGADAVVELLFTHESEQIEKELREVVGESVSKVLRSMKGFEAGEEEMKEFLEKVKTLKIVDPSQEELQEKTVKAVEKCLELFANV